MLSLYIVRHGQTQYNLDKLIQGWCDSPLTEEGINQAKNVGVNLNKIPFKACYCSDSGRTVDTANYILEGRNIPLFKTHKLREMHFGQYEKATFEKFYELGPHPSARGFVEFGGENIEMLTNRLIESLNDIKRNFSDGNILVVSHGRSITTILEHIVPGDNHSKVVDNCSVSILDYIDNNWVIREINNTKYREAI